jgi:hypothetical protein
VYGELGVLAYDGTEDKVQCHICGEWFRALATHVLRTHGWTADEYRQEFGLNNGQSLICQGTKKLLHDINLNLGNYKHLMSQTMSKADLNSFLRQFPRKGQKLRQQANLGKSVRLKNFNPMNEPEIIAKKTQTNRRVWYGTRRQRTLAKSNHRAAMMVIRNRNLTERRYVCPCGDIFPIREELRVHQRICSQVQYR